VLPTAPSETTRPEGSAARITAASEEQDAVDVGPLWRRSMKRMRALARWRRGTETLQASARKQSTAC